MVVEPLPTQLTQSVSRYEMGKYLDQLKKQESPLLGTDRTDIFPIFAEKTTSVSFVSSPSGHLPKNNPSKPCVFIYRLSDNPKANLTMIAPGVDLNQAKEILKDKFGANRLIEVNERNPETFQ